MTNPRIVFMLPLLASISLLQGCLYNLVEETTTATTTTVSTPAAKPAPAPVPPKTASKTQTVRKPAIQKAAVKSIKGDSKPGEKLTPEEAEALIRKLSVCRPH